MEEIIITIPRNPNKPTTIEVNGVKGEGCKDLTRPLEQALGAVKDDKPTEEMYERPLKQRDQQRESV